MKQNINDVAEAAGDTVLTTRDAARLLGVAVSTAQLWMETGAIDSWKTPGGHRRCKLSSVQRLVDSAARSQDKRSPATGNLAKEFWANPHAAYPMLDCEPERLRALAATGLIDSAPEHAFDRITWLATQLTGCPMALVSLLTSERQWFKSRQGLAATETPRDLAFCSHAILHDEGLVVNDAREDERFRDNPLVTGAPFIGFYAGLPVHDAQGQRLGTLCVLDTVPRQLSEEQQRGLRELAAMVSEEIARRR